MLKRISPFPIPVMLTAALIGGASAGLATAQQSLRTGDGLLAVKATMPQQARVGEQFSYDVSVMNMSDLVTLHNIKLKQTKASGFTIESVSVKGQKNGSQKGDGNQKGSNKNKKDSKGNQKNSNKQKNSNDTKATKENSGSQKSGNSSKSSDSQSNASASSNQMKIGKLKPGQSKTFVVKATADKEGELNSCLMVTNYTPALCMTSKVTKPELELTKNAPKKKNRCEMIELEYVVKNNGSGDVKAFEITDSLGKNLATIDGNSKLSFSVDGLDAGETRKFVARVYARKSGEFSSRAVAKAKNSDLKSRSKQTTTKVVSAELQAKLDGPSRLYGGEMAKFAATVTNTGNVAAKDVTVDVSYPGKSSLADISEPTMKKNGGSNDSGNSSSSGNSNNSDDSSKNQPTKASSQDGNKKNKSNSSKSGSKSDKSMSMETQTIEIAKLEPGQTAEFTYAVRPNDVDKVPSKIEARYVCSVEQAEDSSKAKAKASASAMTEAKVVRLPALQLMVVDDTDPVRADAKVTYTIRAWNEGDAKDANVQLIARLPDGLKFDSAQGPTEHEANGDKVTFKPIDTMKPGDRAEYKVTAKSNGSGNVRFEAAMTSKSLDKEAVSEEPTKLVKGTN